MSEKKTAIITGPTSGVGRVIAEGLATQGLEVVLACRDVVKGEKIREAICQKTGARDASVMHLDTANPESIRAFAGSFAKNHQHLQVLVNDAGINQPKRATAPDGVELTFATNVLGYYRLTLALQNLLIASAPARVVNVASVFAGEVDLDDLQFIRRPYSGVKAYQQSKACDRMLSWAFSRRLAPQGVTVNAMSPGFVLTGLYRHMRGPQALLMRLVNVLFGETVEAGADTAIWLATSPAVDGQTGTFFIKRLPRPCEFAGAAREDLLLAACAALSPTF